MTEPPPPSPTPPARAQSSPKLEPIDYARPRTQDSIDEGRIEFAGASHIIWGVLLMLGTCLITPLVAVPMSDSAVFPSPAPDGDVGRITGDLSYLTWLVVLVVLCLAGMNVASGRLLLSRRHRSFSYTIAVLNCLLFPVGTGLGVYTLFVLMSSSVRAEYRVREREFEEQY